VALLIATLLDGRATVTPDKGVFLGTTYRLHPKICQFVSDAFYDSRLWFYEKNVERH
jgi:uncharacterized protein